MLHTILKSFKLNKSDVKLLEEMLSEDIKTEIRVKRYKYLRTW